MRPTKSFQRPKPLPEPMDRRPQLLHFASAGGWLIWVCPFLHGCGSTVKPGALGLVESVVSHGDCVFRSSPRYRVRDNPSHDTKTLMLGFGSLLFHSQQFLALRVGLAPLGLAVDGSLHSSGVDFTCQT